MASTTPVSPKVVSSTITAAATTIVMYLLGLIHFIAVWPSPVKAALLVLVTAGVTYGAGWLVKDPLRPTPVAAAKHHPHATPADPRNEAGQVDAKYALVCVVLGLIAVVLVMVIVGALSIHLG